MRNLLHKIKPGDDGFKAGVFNGSSAYLDLDTMVTVDDGTRATFSWWSKRDGVGVSEGPIQGYANSSNHTFIRYESDGDFRLTRVSAGSIDFDRRTSSLLSSTAWQHFCLQFNSNEVAEEDRCKLWIDGVSTAIGTDNNIGSGDVCRILGGSLTWTRIGYNQNPYYFDGMIALFHGLDGVIAAPTEFVVQHGPTLKPIPYSGLYGTAGFKLDFLDDSDLGKDVSGNNNDFTNVDVTQAPAILVA